ncbi:LacI family transcriptional regulator [Paenibacillus sp. CAA11]|uniref:LacI family DNA-binding transcriptional regulator n=1 Tax=Paenibacillus sp. CAA11 TaxID=1532905 RepID=UPI000D382801|nr:LacI family DNA-binding transcriptional regulator [Paenibacillus sp. CAA11]AWB45458.1 LacI family transcriptional regulator [Paenibacillus sp. CAA11]
MAKKVTMQQIADYLGVSKFVVSKALSGKGGVNETTKERVIEAASQLGYFAQKNAYVKNIKPTAPASLSDRSKQSVIVLMPNIRFQTKDSLYWGKILEGISQTLEAEGLGMVIISEQRMDNFANVLNPSGILGMIGVGEISTSLLLEVHRIGLPMVLVDHEDALIPTDTVFANNVDSITRLTKHLIGLGHERLHFMGDFRFSRSFRDRWIGFRSALEENSLETPALDDPMLSLFGIDRGEYWEEIKSWFAKRKKMDKLPTAIVCANDSIGLTVCSALQSLDISVPQEISVTGFDNIEDAYRGTPPLTTIHVPKEMLGKRAVEKLLNRIANPHDPLEKVLISADIVYRDSVAEPRARG